MFRRSAYLTVVSACSFAALAGGALAADPAGEAVAVATHAVASPGDRVLQFRSPILRGDVIATDATGVAQIEFLDETRLAVGPNSVVEIDSFVFRGDGTVRRLAVDATRGVLRFLTGNSPSRAYTVTTPIATIGFRGSITDIAIADDGTTTVMVGDDDTLLEICSRGTCWLVTGRCSVFELDPDIEARWVSDVEERTDLIETTFPWGFDDSDLVEPFQTSGTCEMRTFHDPDPAEEEPEPPPPPPEPDPDPPIIRNGEGEGIE